ncbi:MAG: lysophospholipid acyltransferase family protein [Candidatus Kapabacteria bacterium]|nr:lysophospholipid acyltransferase family protein [Candidatus Kapabacteria bacterium]
MKSTIASAAIRALARTWSVTIEGRFPTGPCIVAFWHGEMLPVWFAFRALRPVALVSPSTDGAILATLLSDWGYEVVIGSSSRGGKEALQVLVEQAAHNVVLITPDGPRGPAHVAKPGAVIAAHRAGVPLILVRMRSTRTKSFTKSWDRFQLPLPFAQITLHVSAPIDVPAHLSREEIDAMIIEVTEHLHRLGSVTC